MSLPKQHAKLVRYQRRQRRRAARRTPRLSSRGGASTLSAPRTLSILEAPIEAASFFAQVQASTSRKAKVFLDLSSVTLVTLDALAYLLSIVRSASTTCRVRGSFPRDPAARAAIQRSGFLNYLRSNLESLAPTGGASGIFRGQLVATDIADRIVGFVQDRHGIPSDNAVTRSLYATLIECMANTNNHASLVLGTRPFWYVMAYHREDNGAVEFAFLDEGRGIPATVRKGFHERVAELFGARALTPKFDSRLISSALMGEFRTQTKQGKRGKGLPKIFSQAQAGQLRSLQVALQESVWVAEAG